MGGRSIFEQGGSVIGGFVVGRHLDCNNKDGRWKRKRKNKTEREGKRKNRVLILLIFTSNCPDLSILEGYTHYRKTHLGVACIRCPLKEGPYHLTVNISGFPSYVKAIENGPSEKKKKKEGGKGGGG